MSKPVKHLVVCLDEGNGDEAIYVDGRLEFQDAAVYACDIAEAAGDSVIRFTHFATENVAPDWPKRLVEVPGWEEYLKRNEAKR